MAVVKTILKNTSIEAVVKVAGTAANVDIDLDVDLLSPNQVIPGGVDQTVYITGLVWTGANNGLVTITRNSVVIATLQANAAGFLDFSGQGMIPDSLHSTHNINVAISGAQAEVWIRLKKQGGYKSTLETESLSVYDDPAVVG